MKPELILNLALLLSGDGGKISFDGSARKS